MGDMLRSFVNGILRGIGSTVHARNGLIFYSNRFVSDGDDLLCRTIADLTSLFGDLFELVLLIGGKGDSRYDAG